MPSREAFSLANIGTVAVPDAGPLKLMARRFAYPRLYLFHPNAFHTEQKRIVST